MVWTHQCNRVPPWPDAGLLRLISIVEAYVKISRTGLVCLALLWMPALGSAQTVQDAPVIPAAAPPDEQPPAPQPAAPQAPAQAPAQTAPAQQPPATTPPATTPAEAPQQPEGPHIKLPPPPPKIVDVRMPGEAGYYIGFSGWLPMGTSYVDKGHGSTFTD